MTSENVDDTLNQSIEGEQQEIDENAEDYYSSDDEDYSDDEDEGKSGYRKGK
jgi:hypothetical protein